MTGERSQGDAGRPGRPAAVGYVVQPGMVQASKRRPGSEAEAASPAALWAGVARQAR